MNSLDERTTTSKKTGMLNAWDFWYVALSIHVIFEALDSLSMVFLPFVSVPVELQPVSLLPPEFPSDANNLATIRKGFT